MDSENNIEQEPLPQDFELALRALETCVSEMERGNLSLEASLKSYQRGVELAQICQRTLNVAQQKVQVLEEQLLKPLELSQQEGRD